MAKKLRDFFRDMRIHPLVAWTRYFDINYDRRIDAEEFRAGMEQLDFPGDEEELFHEIDTDGSGYITMNEIDHVSTDLWNSFRAWCGQSFTSAEEMEAQLTNCVFSQGLFTVHAGVKLSKEEISSKKATLVAHGGFTKKQFLENSVRLGWYGEWEVILFKALDRRKCGRVCAKDIGWFEKERWRQVRLHAHRARGTIHGNSESIGVVKVQRTPVSMNMHLQMHSKVQAGRALRAFLTYLRRSFGCLFRAWRCLLDSDGTMKVTRKQFIKACQALGWRGDVSALWHALDWDDSGTTGLQDLAPYEARILALYKRWADKKYGSAKTAMQALNTFRGTKFKVNKAGRLTLEQFVDACAALHCPCDPFEIFDLMDWEICGSITVSDMKCLDKWNVTQEWLTAEPDAVAAKNFIDMLITRYRHVVKAWCRALDRWSCGRATFADFKWAVEHISFKGNSVGAWLALDSDSSGFITLREVDEQAACVLAQFRCWAHDTFGSVVLTIETLDVDGSGALSLREFRRGLKDHGYRGEPHNLFFSLDCDGSGELSASEVAFLDEWELSEMLDLHEDFPHDEFEEEEEEEELEIKSYFENKRTEKRRKRRKRAMQWPRVHMAAKAVPPKGGSLDCFNWEGYKKPQIRRKQAVHEKVLSDLGYDVKSMCSSRMTAWSMTSWSSARNQASIQTTDGSEGDLSISAESLLHLVGCRPLTTQNESPLLEALNLPGQAPQGEEHASTGQNMDSLAFLGTGADLQQVPTNPMDMVSDTLQQKVTQKRQRAPWASGVGFLSDRGPPSAQNSETISWNTQGSPQGSPWGSVRNSRLSAWGSGPSSARNSETMWNSPLASARNSAWSSARSSMWSNPGGHAR
mmetsp:Transcript_90617/g.173816  ORF Transcript_90617/g.173816 Transcript_90617/m.173816 type:complete len:861 (+) Transcript_90617:120-2702(+)